MLSSYDEDKPRVVGWVIGRQVCSLVEARSHFDALTYNGVIWYPSESHWGTRLFLGICIFFGWIKIGEILHRHLHERILRQFKFQ